VNHPSRQHSISWFQEQYKDGRLELRPPFQRKPVWLDKQRCSLIESILLDIPIPEIYVQVSQADDGSELYGVVDGQQRLRSILQFIGIERKEDQEKGENKNKFSLDLLPSTSAFRNKTFFDLPQDMRMRFFQYEICVRYLYTNDTREVEDVFKRLNKFTLPLKPQELRNATYHGAFPKLSERLADDEYWAMNRIVTPAAIRRMSDIELMSDLLIGLLHGPQGGSAKIIDQYYEQYEQFEEEFPEQSRIEQLFLITVETVKALFPKIVETPRWGNRADFYSLFVGLGNLFQDYVLPKSAVKKLAAELGKFARAVSLRLEKSTVKTSALVRKYARAIEKGVNDKARRTDRHEALTAIIVPFLKAKK
jgi:hypothetical protein